MSIHVLLLLYYSRGSYKIPHRYTVPLLVQVPAWARRVAESGRIQPKKQATTYTQNCDRTYTIARVFALQPVGPMLAYCNLSC